MEITIGIDLGTTFSAVAAVDKNGLPFILKNDEGKALTPSVLYFGKDELLIGDAAKEMQAIGEENVASFFKRSMGDPNFLLHFHGKDYSPVDLSALLLKKLKADAEAALGQTVSKAVITVPAYFTDPQRKATKLAGQQAGLEVLRVINEPTAAAIAYGVKKTTNQTVLVYDLGGGTFDITLMRINEEGIEVLATDGDHELGGKDWDDRIINHISARFEEDFGMDPLEDDFSVNDILIRAENAKKELSSRNKARITLSHKGERATYELERDTFENLTQDLLERTKLLAETMLQESQLSWQDLDGVLLVGGSTRMPMVSQWVEEMSGKTPLRGVNVDEAIALGAAIQAHLDVNQETAPEATLLLGGAKNVVDVMSHSLGLVAENKDRSRYLNSIIIPKNKHIPSVESRPYQLHTRPNRSNQWDAYMTQGESENPTECKVIGKYVFSDIQHTAAGFAVLDISYAYDISGMIQVEAVQRDTGKPLKLTVEPVPADMSWLALPPEQHVEEVMHTTVAFAIDLSGSMSGTPLIEAKKAAKKFINQLDLAHTSVGLIAFADRVGITHDITQNAKKLYAAIDSWSIGSVGGGNSAHPFTDSLNMLKHAEGPTFLVVLTDGLWYAESVAIAGAKKCKQQDIEIIAVGFGSANQAFLRQIATSDANAMLTNQAGLVSSMSKIAQVMTSSGGAISQGGKKGLLNFLK